MGVFGNTHLGVVPSGLIGEENKFFAKYGPGLDFVVGDELHQFLV